ncbi:type VI secretion system baseplate subunit TssE [Spiribacter halobius]|uniref:Type VI secretion system baseplate subunit TssE n=2 Tax=Sediminicurvatus halobius TaxID=2182432 RepID=A0A2U2N2J0_9GAMM|nr:type VI secretion system baseplate subunit TssE [Spiribacter halobius]
MEAHEFTLVAERVDGDRPVAVYEGAPGTWRVRRLLDHTFRPRREAPEVAVRELATVARRQLIPNTSESQQDRVISARQLKESVMRDLAWLLNTGHLASLVPLEAYPQIRRSVLNYGIPELAGTTISGADVEQIAAAIRGAIEVFEPRLRDIRVTPQAGEAGRGNTLAFLIEADLWGQPSPQHLSLRTELDLEAAAVTVRGAAEGGA